MQAGLRKVNAMKKLVCVFLSVFLLCQNFVFAKSSENIEVFKNPGFEQGMSEWYTSGSGFSITNSESTEGTQSLKFFQDSLEYAKFMQPLKVEKNKSYSISFDMKSSSGEFNCCVETVLGEISQTNVYGSENVWKRYTVEFDSGDNNEVVFGIKNTVLPTQNVYFDNFEISENVLNLVVNGDFENGKNGWERQTFNLVSEDTYEGKTSAVHWGESSYFYQKIAVEKNTEYRLTFAYKNKNLDASNNLRIVVAGNAGINSYGYPTDGNSLMGDSVGGDITRAGKLYELSTEWMEEEEKIYTGENTEIYLSIIHDNGNHNSSNAAPYFDSFRLSPLKEQNLVVNGDFEDGKNGWERQTFNLISEGVYEGKSSAVHWGESSYIYQKIEVEKNSEYGLTFAYKNKNLDASNNLRIVVAGNAGVNSYGYPTDGISLIGDSVGGEITRAGKLYELSTEWTEEEEIISTGENTEIYLSVIHDNSNQNYSNAAPYFDDFKLFRIRENMILNGSFENGKSGWPTDRFNVIDTYSYDKTHSASMWGAETYLYQKIKVKKNVDYNLSFAYMNTDTEKTNKVRVTVSGECGIDTRGYPTDGKSLIDEKEGIAREKPGKRYPIAGQWTVVNETFNSGDNETVYVVLMHDLTNGREGYKPPLIDNVKMQAAEYDLIDFDFEFSGLKNCEANSAEIVRDEESVYNGRRSARVFDSTNSRIASLSKSVAVEKQKNFVLSYWYKNEAYGHNLSIYDSDYKLSEEVTRIVPIKKLREEENIWNYVTESFNSGDNSVITVDFSGNNSNNRSSFCLDDIKLTMPQPEIDTAALFGYVEQGKTIYSHIDSINLNGDTLNYINYQWQSSDDGVGWEDIENAVDDKYTVTEKDVEKKLRLKITPIGNTNTGNEYYTKPIDSSSELDFENELIRRINAQLIYLPGWLNSRYTEYIDSLLELCSMAGEYDIELSGERIKYWNRFLDITSNISSVKSIKTSALGGTAVIAELTAPIKLTEFERFCVYTSNGKQVNITIEPTEKIQYTRTDGTVVDFVKGLKISSSDGYKNGSYVLKRTTVYGETYCYDFSVRRMAEIKNAAAEINNKTVTVTAEISNTGSDVPIKAMIYAAVYDNKNKLIGVRAEKAELIKGGAAKLINKSIAAGESSDMTGAKTAIYVWNRQSGVPYAEKAVIIAAEEKLSAGK